VGVIVLPSISQTSKPFSLMERMLAEVKIGSTAVVTPVCGDQQLSCKKVCPPQAAT
jgi:hypothetical protein